jgi:hypothetical protein
MSTTHLADVTNQVQKFWAPKFTKQLRADLLLGSLVNKDYQGEIKIGGDKVTVSQINKGTGQLLDAQSDDSFDTTKIETTYVEVTANKRAVSAKEFHDIVSLQSQIDNNPEIMDTMIYEMNEQINTYLYSLVSPSTSSPDHSIASVTDFNAAALASYRILASQAKWNKLKPWYALLDPVYYGDILDDSTIASSDYGATDRPVVGGQLAIPRYGFNIFEDNSRSADNGLLFHPDFLLFVQQTQVQVKISDLHPLGRFGVKMSVDLIFGAALGPDGAKKHIKVYNS